MVIETVNNSKLGAILVERFNVPMSIVMQLKYNVMTPKQVNQMTGKAMSSLYKDADNGKITNLHPFPVSEDNLGPRFFAVDNKMLNYLREL